MACTYRFVTTTSLQDNMVHPIHDRWLHFLGASQVLVLSTGGVVVVSLLHALDRRREAAGPFGGLNHLTGEVDVENTRTLKKTFSGSRLESWVHRMACMHPSMRASWSRGLGAIDSGRQKTGRRKALQRLWPRQQPEEAHQRQRICDFLSGAVAATFSIVFLFYHYFAARLSLRWSRSCCSVRPWHSDPRTS